MAQRITTCFLWLLLAVASSAARADLLSAQTAYKAGNFEQAFTEFKELAELGQPIAQLNLGVLYARGEGTSISNTYAYAWTSLAAENGVDSAQKISADLKAVLTPGSLAIADGIRQQYGREALDARLMPKLLTSGEFEDKEPCKIDKAHLPPYPPQALSKGVQGGGYVEFTVMPDGRARSPRLLYALPMGYFEKTIRESVRKSKFIPGTKGGQPGPCVMNVYYSFALGDLDAGDYPKLDKLLTTTKASAEAGDPQAQLLYGLLISGLPQIRKPRAEALPWFLKAAQAGSALAQFQTGNSMLLGWGCQCEEDKAAVWLRKAAEADQPDAQVTLAGIALRGDPTEEDIERARIWLERAAASNNPDGKLYLAALLAAAPSDRARNPDRSLELTQSILKSYDDDPTIFEIRAAAFAAKGQFAEATKEQKAALKMAKRLSWDVTPQAARLARYESGQPWFGDLLAF